MEELNRKLAEWAGFDRTTLPSGNQGWLYPTQYVEAYGFLPIFTESLDACDKWLIPKLTDNGVQVELWAYCNLRPTCTLHHLDDDSEYQGEGDSLALAFCCAIEKLIDGKKI